MWDAYFILLQFNFYSDEESKSRQKEDHKVLFHPFLDVFSFTVLTELAAHSVVLELTSFLRYFVSCVF